MTARAFALVLILFTASSSRAQVPPALAADSLFQQGVALYTAGQYRAAGERFGAMCDSVTPQIVFYLAMSHLSLNNVLEGIPLLRKAVALDQGNSGYRYQYARTLAQSGSPELAAAEYEALIAGDSTFTAARYQLGLLRYEQRRYNEAAGLFRAVTDANPGDYLSYYYLSSSLVGQAELDSARPYLASCVSLNPRYTPAVTLLASIYYGAGEYAEALRLYTAAAGQRPSDADLPYKIGLCYGKLGRIDSALAYTSAAARRDTANDVYIAQAGYYYLVEQQFDSALAAYRKAVRIDGENSLYFTNLAFAFSQLNDNDSAIAAYERGVAACHPENIAMIDLRLGTLYYFQKQYRKALSAYQHALDLDPLNKEAQYYVALAYVALAYDALAYDALANPQTAARQYRKYLSLAKDDTTALERERKKQAGDRLRVLRP